MDRNVAVIGSGIGGLSAALDLQTKGFQVDLYEKNAFTGGKAGCEKGGGFTFDTGPSLLTMPFVFEDLLKKAGIEARDVMPVRKLDIICKYFFSDGTVLNAFSDQERIIEEFREKTSDSPEDIRRFFNYCRRMYEDAKDLFLFNSLEDIPEFFRENPLKGIAIISGLDIFRTLHGSHRRFFKDSNTVQLFDRYATYSGSDPYLIPATLNIIPHVEYGIGAYVPEKGIRAIPRVLAETATAKGVRIFTGQKVDSVIVGNKDIRGIRSCGREVPYSKVVSNADVSYTYKYLLDDRVTKMARRYDKLEPSSSAIVFYWGIKGIFSELEINNIFFSSDYRKEFREIFLERSCPEEPTVYVNITSKYCPEDAPEGHENWFVLVNVPYDTGQDWEREALRIKARVLDILERRLKKDITGNIIYERIMTPCDIYEKTLSNKGSIYGISSNSKFAAFFRQPNRSVDYKGLYFAGGSAHPGGGMPLVALSGMIASELIARN